jgi:hypothetical protein
MAPNDRMTSLPTMAAGNPLDLKAKQDMVAGINGLQTALNDGFVNTLQVALDQLGDVRGDLIYRNASAWVALAAGTSGQFLQTKGSSANPVWANGLVTVALQTFTSGGTYTPTSGMLYCLMVCIGGGAGGGGSANSAGGSAAGGGGGGGGSISIKLSTAATVGASQTVTIGAVANGGSAGNNAGTAGNDTSIGSICVGKGGSAGGGSDGTASGTAGAGGVAGTGDLTFVGNSGTTGPKASIITVALMTGRGGSGPLGGSAGGGNVSTNTNGAAGANYGAGGNGGVSWNGGGTASGGNGAQGVAFVLEFVKGS